MFEILNWVLFYNAYNAKLYKTFYVFLEIILIDVFSLRVNVPKSAWLS